MARQKTKKRKKPSPTYRERPEAPRSATGSKSIPAFQAPIKALNEDPTGMKIPNKQGYMDKERLETETRYRQHQEWLKAAQAQSGEIHKTHQAAMDELAAETRARARRFIATNKKYAATLGKFDDCREEVRAMKW